MPERRRMYEGSTGRPGPASRPSTPKPKPNPVSNALNAIGRGARDVTRARESFHPMVPTLNWGQKKYGPQAPGIQIGPRTKKP